MIGLATIGQSPRDDVVSSMFDDPAATAVIQAGALDSLERSEVRELEPGPGDHPLVTRLGNGDEVFVAKSKIVPLLNTAIRRLETGGADIICVLCTGEFDGLQSKAKIVYPDRILRAAIDEVLPRGTLGVIAPTQGQVEMMRSKWARLRRSVLVVAASPYTEQDNLGRAAAALEDGGAELIVLDCMGYTRAMQDRVRHAVRVPVVLANGLVGAMLGAMEPELRGKPQQPTISQPADG